MRRHTFHPLCTFLIAGALSSCAPERADLEVELLPPVASRFVVHGNCFAGWYMVVDLLVHERRGVDAVLDSVSLRVEDDRTGELLGERMAEATFLRERFGEYGAVVPAHGSLRIPMSGGALEGSVDAPAISGSIVVSGDVEGYDERGRVRTSYRVAAVVTVEDRPVPSSDACTPRS
jgi:hypothetical protein